jgi:hypothetical protein
MNTQYYRGIRFERSIFVELNLKTGYAIGNQLNFLDVPQLSHAYVQGIEAFTDSQLAKTPTTNSVFEDAAKTQVLMTFKQLDDQRYENIPYYTLMATNNGGLIRNFHDLQININSSYAFMGGTTATAGKSLAFVFYYSYQPQYSRPAGMVVKKK